MISFDDFIVESKMTPQFKKELAKLSADQQKSIKSLIRLGDSPEVAMKTVMGKKPGNKEAYRRAYES